MSREIVKTDSSLPELLPGDLIFTKKKILGGEHVAISVGNGEVVHAVPPKVKEVPLSELEETLFFKLLDGIGSVYRVKDAGEEERLRVSNYALDQVGKLYTLLETKCGESRWSCCKLVWRSWLEGTDRRINLDPEGFLVTPWDLKNSPHVYTVWEDK